MVRATSKQRTIMGVILREFGQGRIHNIQELHKLLPYTCHYGSFRRSLDFLERGGVIVREQAGTSNLIKPTVLAYERFVPDR